METYQFNSLPAKLLPNVFEHLPFVDLIRSRRVCKRFLKAIDTLRIEELVIYDTPFFLGARWLSGSIVDAKNVIKLDPLYEEDEYEMYKNQLMKLKQLNNLKRIMFLLSCFEINESVTTEFFEPLLRFKKLEEVNALFGLGFYQIIKHPNVTTLAIGSFCNRKCRLNIDCPKLKWLSFDSLGMSVHIVHPNSITRLDSLDFNDNGFDISSLKNLKRITTRSLKFWCGSYSRALTKLEEIVFDARQYGQNDDEDDEGKIELRETKKNIKNLLKRKKAPKLWINNEELKSIEQFEKIYLELNSVDNHEEEEDDEFDE